MSQKVKYIQFVMVLILSGIIIKSCRQSFPKNADNYPKDSLVSDSLGKARNSFTHYLPYFFKSNDSLIPTNQDSIINGWYSFNLFKFNEPVLSNYYLGHDIYRFLWLRSFHRPVVITLSNYNNKITLTTKEFDIQAHYFELRHCLNCDTLNLREPKLVLNESKELTINEWEHFENLLAQCNFWKIPPFKREFGNDGSEWNIEAHLKGKYRFVNRWSPKDQFVDCGKYLIELSGLKEDIK